VTINGNALFNNSKIGMVINDNNEINGGRVDLTRATIGGDLEFKETIFTRDMILIEATINKRAIFEKSEARYFDFRDSTIGTHLWFSNVKAGSILFEGLTINGIGLFFDVEVWNEAEFMRMKVWDNLDFTRSVYHCGIDFKDATFGKEANFNKMTVKGNAFFHSAKFNGPANFRRSEFQEDFNLRNALFALPRAQEDACRVAKNLYSIAGNREEADYYFYREMEAKRLQKNWIIRILEWPIQRIFDYGTSWIKLILTWAFLVFGFATLFYVTKAVEGACNFWQYVYFSIVTITTLGYGDLQPVSETLWQLTAGFEALLGTFMWAALIATFTRKYMR